MVWGALVLIASSAAMLVLGIWLLSRQQRRRAPVLILGVFLVFRGLLNGLQGAWWAGQGFGWSEATLDAVIFATPLLLVCLPLFVLLFVSYYPQRRGPLVRSKLALVGLVGLVALAGLIYILDPQLYFLGPGGAEGMGRVALAWMARWPGFFLIPLYAIVGLLLSRDYLVAGHGPDRRAILVVAAGFLFDGAYLAARDTAELLFTATPNAYYDATNLKYYAHPPALLAVAALVALFAWHAWRTDSRTERRRAAGMIGAAIVPVVAGLFIPVYLVLPEGLQARLAISGVSVLALPLALTYGIMRRELFGLDLRVKRTLETGTVAAILAGVYVVARLLAQHFLADDASQSLAVVLTGLFLFALVPLQRIGGRVADAAMPGVREDGAYLDQRKLEVYRAALEDAVGGDGQLPNSHSERLERLRARLGLSDRDHAVLLHAVRQPGPTLVTPLFQPGRTVLSRYRIEEVLGEGGQGTTYQALDTTLGREVVLKAVHGQDPRRVLEEARALAAIQHANVVTIHDVERVGDHVYLVMEHVDGGSLKDRLRAGPLDEAAFHHVAGDLLSGLQAVHDAGLVHRDVKPSNVLLSLDGPAKLADLGIATAAEPSEQTTLGARSMSARGTIAYMSPEQARGDKLTPASDLFSAAATLYEAYMGGPLFETRPGESAVELQARVAAWSGFEEELDDAESGAWFAKALAPAPRDRYESATAMRTMFERARRQAGGERDDARSSGNQGAG